MEGDLDRMGLVEGEVQIPLLKKKLEKVIRELVPRAGAEPDLAGNVHVGGQQIAISVRHRLVDPSTLARDGHLDVESAQGRRVDSLLRADDRPNSTGIVVASAGNVGSEHFETTRTRIADDRFPAEFRPQHLDLALQPRNIVHVSQQRQGG